MKSVFKIIKFSTAVQKIGYLFREIAKFLLVYHIISRFNCNFEQKQSGAHPTLPRYSHQVSHE